MQHHFKLPAFVRDPLTTPSPRNQRSHPPSASARPSRCIGLRQRRRVKTVRPSDRVAPGNPHSRTGREIPGCGGWASNPAPARVASKRRQPPAALAPPQPPAPAAPTGLPERQRTDAETHALLRPACVPTSSRASTSSRTGAGSRTLQVPAAWGRGERAVDCNVASTAFAQWAGHGACSVARTCALFLAGFPEGPRAVLVAWRTILGRDRERAAAEHSVEGLYLPLIFQAPSDT